MPFLNLFNLVFSSLHSLSNHEFLGKYLFLVQVLFLTSAHFIINSLKDVAIKFGEAICLVT